VRAAAAQALGRAGSDAALERAAAVARGDASARVRRAALRAYLARRPPAPAGDGAAPAGLALAAELLRDPDPGVREEAAVALGVRDLDGAAAPLIGALADASWEVSVAAAVSLGKTRLTGAVERSRRWRTTRPRRTGAGAGRRWSGSATCTARRPSRT
jgi:HEAT repeat protein